MLQPQTERGKQRRVHLCSSQGSPEDEAAREPRGHPCYPGVHGAVDPHRSISNSVVKRSSGEDSWGEAPCKNSSMPGKTFFFPHLVCMAIKSQPDPELRSQQREQAHPVMMLLSFQFSTRKRPRPPQGWPFCCRLDGGYRSSRNRLNESIDA